MSDDYESSDKEKVGTSNYQRLQLNNKDMNCDNETFMLNTLKNGKTNNKCAKDYWVEGIIIVLLDLISL